MLTALLDLRERERERERERLAICDGAYYHNVTIS